MTFTAIWLRLGGGRRTGVLACGPEPMQRLDGEVRFAAVDAVTLSAVVAALTDGRPR